MVYNVMKYLRSSSLTSPDKTYFSDSISSLTYGHLWNITRSAGTAIAHSMGQSRRSPVFICIDRSVETVAAIWSIIASGNFYVPVDTSLPDLRLAELYRTMNPLLVITLGSNKNNLPFPQSRIKSFQELCSETADDRLLDEIENSVLNTDPLYCIFTSGSTGIPKGVLISHGSVINMTEQFTEQFNINNQSIMGNQAPFDFDVSVKDLFLSVRNIATVCILEKSLFSAPARLIARLNEKKINTLVWSVSALKIISALKTFRTSVPQYLKLVMFSGEVLPCKVLNDWMEHLPSVQFINLYGPTEITCNCTFFFVDRPFSDDDRIPVGHAFPNMNVFLLNGENELTSPNETGEICVGGAGLALGYYGNSEKTNEAFCQDPRYPNWPRKMYRTGDLGFWNENGELVFSGRADSQVKHMGFRIELGEIELAANAIDFVDSACCIYDYNKEQICLFYQSAKQDDRRVMAEIRKRLPRFMSPNRIFYFPKLPENRTGKIDRNVLKEKYITNR